MPGKLKKRKVNAKSLKGTWPSGKIQDGHLSVESKGGDSRSGIDNNAKMADNDVTAEINLLPPCTPWVVMAVTLVIRVYYVTRPWNWWVLHPDEVFQSMDVAHSLTYGYGFRPYEFLSPARGDNLSHYQLREVQLGMHGLRSPVYPQFLALVASLCSTLGLEVHPFLVWRISQAVVTSSLPLAASLFVRASSQSKDVAALTSILIGSSSCLAIFGTHTIVNSFISPFLFFALSRLFHLLSNDEGKTHRKETRVAELCDTQTHSHAIDPMNFRLQSGVKGRVTAGERVQEGGFVTLTKDKPKPDRSSRSSFTDSVFKDGYNRKTVDPGLANGRSTFIPEARESVSSDSGFENWSGSSHGGSTSNSLSDSHSEDDDRENDFNNDMHRVKSDQTFVIAETDRQQTVENSQSQKVAILCEERDSHSVRRPGVFVANASLDLGSGILLGTCVYIRPDSCIFVAIVILARVGLVSIFRTALMGSSLWAFLSGVVVAIFTCIANDFYFFQEFLISPWNWFHFNVLSNMASGLYGSCSLHFYVSSVFLGDLGMASLSITVFLGVILSLTRYPNRNFGECRIQRATTISPQESENVVPCRIMPFNNICQKCKYLYNFFNDRSIMAHYSYGFILFVIIYSAFDHKEERFMHDGIVLYFIAAAGFVLAFIHQHSQHVITKRFTLTALIVSFSVSQWQAMPTNDSSDVNQCLHFLSKQSDARGLFLESQIPYTFSYSLLHQNIPIVTVLHKEFIEFDAESVIRTNRSCLVTKYGCRVSYVSLNSVSNVFHLRNAQGIIRHLLTNCRKYNYAITSSSKEFFSPAYQQVFRTATHNVWRLSDKAEDRRSLEKTLAGMVDDRSQQRWHEYEAEVLKQLGNYRLAIGRFDKAMKYAYNRTKMLASQGYCLQRLGLDKEARRVFKECIRESGPSECLKGGEGRVPIFGSGKMNS